MDNILETWDLGQISGTNLKKKNATLINALIGSIFWNKNISCNGTFKLKKSLLLSSFFVLLAGSLSREILTDSPQHFPQYALHCMALLLVVHCKLLTVCSTLLTVLSCTVRSTLYGIIVGCTVYTAHCTLYTVRNYCWLYIVHCSI